jgi:hypothetical protein
VGTNLPAIHAERMDCEAYGRVLSDAGVIDLHAIVRRKNAAERGSSTAARPTCKIEFTRPYREMACAIKAGGRRSWW